MRAIAFGIAVFCLAAGVAHAQTFNDLQIELGAYNQSDKGGERPVGVWFSTGPLTIRRANPPATFSIAETCDAWAVSSDGSLYENATTAWRIEVTAIRVVRDAVTFRLRWNRFAALRQQLDQIPLDGGKGFRIPSEDIELTLRPGESWPVDAVRVPPGAKTVEGRACRGNATIRVRVDHYPSEDFERRLVVADLWLVERLSNGSEAPRSQISVRGLPNRPFPFYFDPVADTKASLDMYGTLAAKIESGAIAVALDTWSRWGDPGDVRSSPGRSVESAVQLKPSETVEIRLPKFDTGPFANREFSIRIRARQLR